MESIYGKERTGVYSGNPCDMGNAVQTGASSPIGIQRSLDATLEKVQQASLTALKEPSSEHQAQVNLSTVWSQMCESLVKGREAFGAKKYQESTRYYLVALEKFQLHSGGEPSLQLADLLAELLIPAHRSNMPPKELLAYAQQALDLYEKFLGAKPTKLRATAANFAGLAAHKLSDYNAGVRYFTLALQHSRAVYGEHHRMVISYAYDFGKLFSDAGYYDHALAYFKKCEEIEQALQLDDKELDAEIASARGFVFLKKGDYQQALVLFKQAESNMRQLGELDEKDQATLATCTENVLFVEKVIAAQPIIDKADQFVLFTPEGEISQTPRCPETAIAALEAGVKAYTSIHGEGACVKLAKYHSSMSIYFEKLDRIQEAFDEGVLACNLFQAIDMHALNEIEELIYFHRMAFTGIYASKLNKNKEMIAYFDRACSIIKQKPHSSDAELLKHIGGMLFTKELPAEGLKYLNEAQTIYDQFGLDDSKLASEIAGFSAHCYSKLEDFANTQQRAKQAIDILERAGNLSEKDKLFLDACRQFLVHATKMLAAKKLVATQPTPKRPSTPSKPMTAKRQGPSSSTGQGSKIVITQNTTVNKENRTNSSSSSSGSSMTPANGTPKKSDGCVMQ